MQDHSSAKYGQAFAEILFLHPRSDNIQRLSRPKRIILYILASALFYVPILYFIVKSSIANRDLIIYFITIGIMHVLSKIMLYNSKRIQKRFSTVKSRENFFLRIWLIIEYVFFMWGVYLFYPLTCILAPISLWGMSLESMLGYNVLVNFFSQNSEQFIMFGGISSYILFIFSDGYRKLKTGFLPDYLGLYALLSIISTSVEGSMKRLLNNWVIDISRVTSVLSEIFTLSNQSMKIVASGVTFFFAIYSLYNSCGETSEEKNKEEIYLGRKTDENVQNNLYPTFEE